MNRYPGFDDDSGDEVAQAEYSAAIDPTNHWPAERYMPEAIERAAESISDGIAWFGFWLAVGAVALALAWAR